MNTKPDMSLDLNETQAQAKIAREGFNELPSSKPRNLFAIALGVVREPMFLLLVACGTLYLIFGDMQEGLMLLGFVFVIIGIELYQEKFLFQKVDLLEISICTASGILTITGFQIFKLVANRSKRELC